MIYGENIRTVYKCLVTALYDHIPKCHLTFKSVFLVALPFLFVGTLSQAAKYSRLSLFDGDAAATAFSVLGNSD